MCQGKAQITWISPVLIYLIKMWVWYLPKLHTWMLMDIIGIDLFDQNMSMTCAKVGLRCSWISLILIYLIKLWIRYVPKLDSDAHGYH